MLALAWLVSNKTFKYQRNYYQMLQFKKKKEKRKIDLQIYVIVLQSTIIRRAALELSTTSHCPSSEEKSHS